MKNMAQGKIKTAIASGLVSLAGIVNSGCVMPECRDIMEPQQVYDLRINEGRGGSVAIEGLQPYSGCKATTLGANFAEKYTKALSASSGDWWSHLKFCRQVYAKGGELTLIGFSAGCDEIRALARELKNEKIKVKRAIVIEHTYTRSGNIFWGPWTDNVEEIVGIRGGGTSWWGGDRDLDYRDVTGNTKIENTMLPSQSGDDLEEHLSIPERAYEIIDNEFQEIEREKN